LIEVTVNYPLPDAALDDFISVGFPKDPMPSLNGLLDFFKIH
jgi:hypothetical protein